MRATTGKKSQPSSPVNRAAQALSDVANKRAPKKQTRTEDVDPGPEQLPENWGVGDLVRVGKSRISRAIWGPPKRPTSKKE